MPENNLFLMMRHLLNPVAYAESLNLPFGPLFDWQKQILKAIGDSSNMAKPIDVCVNGARQAGKSTIISVLPCHMAKFHPGSLSIIIAPTKDQAKEDMGKIKSFIRCDSSYPRMRVDNTDELEFDNSSRIVVVPATDAARGKSAPSLIILDEASRIEDYIYNSVVLPMLNDVKQYIMVRISTPNGRSGYFFEDFNDKKIERFEIRSPFDVSDVDNYTLIPAEPEEQYKAKMSEKGIWACYSPQHGDFERQSMFLRKMGKLKYQQEFCCMFVEPEDQVFRYSDIERMFAAKAPVETASFGVAPSEDFLDLRGDAV